MANMTSSHPASQVAAELASAPPDQIEGLLERYRDDPRAQVRKACERARRRLDRERTERERVEGMYARMRELGGAGVVVGVDEVGRGAVCLPDEPRIWGVNDSKQLSPARREMLAVRIAETARAIGICHIPPERIDAIGMARSLREAVAGAVADTGLAPSWTATPWAPFPTSATSCTATRRSPASPPPPSWRR